MDATNPRFDCFAALSGCQACHIHLTQAVVIPLPILLILSQCKTCHLPTVTLWSIPDMDAAGSIHGKFGGWSVDLYNALIALKL